MALTNLHPNCLDLPNRDRKNSDIMLNVEAIRKAFLSYSYYILGLPTCAGAPGILLRSIQTRPNLGCFDPQSHIHMYLYICTSIYLIYLSIYFCVYTFTHLSTTVLGVPYLGVGRPHSLQSQPGPSSCQVAGQQAAELSSVPWPALAST